MEGGSLEQSPPSNSSALFTIQAPTTHTVPPSSEASLPSPAALATKVSRPIPQICRSKHLSNCSSYLSNLPALQPLVERRFGTWWLFRTHRRSRVSIGMNPESAETFLSSHSHRQRSSIQIPKAIERIVCPHSGNPSFLYSSSSTSSSSITGEGSGRRSKCARTLQRFDT